MKTFIYLIWAATTGTLHLSSSAPSPAPWKRWTYCKKADPSKNNLCLAKAIQGSGTDLLPGSPYFGIPSIDPLHLEELSIQQEPNSNKAVAIDLTLKNCDIIGLNSYEIKDVRADWEKGWITILSHMNGTVDFLSDYKMSGKILLLPITGEGKTKVTYENMDVQLDIKGKIIEKKNRKYYVVDSIDVDLRPKGMKMKFQNLFNGNKALGDNMNKILNDNWQDILKEVKGPVGKGLGAAFKVMSLRVFSKIPFDVLVPK